MSRVDVDGEQVVAALGAVVEHVVEEEVPVQALALKASLHVGEGDPAAAESGCPPSVMRAASATATVPRSFMTTCRQTYWRR